MGNYRDESKYEVKFIDEKVYIKYKEKEYCTDIKNMQCENTPRLKDQNGEKISLNVLSEIMQYARNKYKQLIKEKLDKMTVLNKEEIVSKFKGIRLASEEEKEQYIEYIKKSNNDPAKYIMGIFFFFLAFVMLKTAVTENWLMIFFTIIFGMCGYIFINTRLTKTLLKKVMNGTLYISDCYSCDLERKHSKKSNNLSYYIRLEATETSSLPYFVKVTDNEGKYINEWFEIDYKSLDNKGETKAKLYVVEYNGEYNLQVCTERMLKLGKIVNT